MESTDEGGRALEAVPMGTAANTRLEAGTDGASEPDLTAVDDVRALVGSLEAVTVTASNQLRLESAFRTAWHDRIVDIRERAAYLEALARRLEVGPDRLALSVTVDGFTATCDRDRIGVWPSNAAFLADIAAASVLEDRDAGWNGIDAHDRGTVLMALRLFLERCPNCDGAVVEVDPAAVSISEFSDRALEGGEPRAASASADSVGGVSDSVALECERCGVMVVRDPYE